MQGKIQETIRISFNLNLTVLVESKVEDDVETLNLRIIMKVVSKAIQTPTRWSGTCVLKTPSQKWENSFVARLTASGFRKYRIWSFMKLVQDRLDRIKSLLSKITFLTKVRVCYKYCIYRKNDAFVAKIGNRKVGNMHLTKFFVGIYNCNSAIKVISIDSGPQSQVIRPGGGGRCT